MIVHRPGSAHCRKGTVVAITAILMVFLVGMVAFTIDIGMIAATRTQLQRTADAAAQASVVKIAGTTTLDAARNAVRPEAKVWAAYDGNGGLSLLDTDIEILNYNSAAASGSRLSVPTGNPFNANAVRVRTRRDVSANGQLSLSFAPIFGVSAADVRAEAVAVLQQATGFGPGSDVIPFAVPENYYYKAMNQPLRPATDQPIPPDSVIKNTLGVSSNGTVSNTADTVNEFLLYSSDSVTSGNYGSIDLGTASNGTQELTRQLLTGLNAGDLSAMDATMEARATSTGIAGYRNVVSNGSFTLPQSMLPISVPPSAAGLTTGVTFNGDPGISSALKSSFSQIIGEIRTIPLYAGVVGGTGNNSTFRVVKFVPVYIMSSDFQGNPKQVWVQPVTGSYIDPGATSGGTGTVISNVFTAHPKLAVP